MKIALCSHRFAPEIGGIETASAAFAEQFAALGHEVCVITATAEDDRVPRPYRVLRRPSPGALFAIARWCDVFFQNNVSLQTLWPAFLLGKRAFVTHQTWLVATGEREGWSARLKRAAFRFTTNIAISESVAAHVGRPCTIIHNPYRSETFRMMPEVPRDRDLACLGRLVSDKGMDLLLEALRTLDAKGRQPTLTIIGSGPEEAKLRELTRQFGLEARVHFAGALTGDALARALNGHRILVTPSRWAEPFGIVALEGIACGCVVVGSDGGGLPEAIGPCGATFPNGDASALATVLDTLLGDEAQLATFRRAAPAHLERHTAAAIARDYLDLFSRDAR